MILIRDDVPIPFVPLVQFLLQHQLVIVNTGACLEVVPLEEAARIAATHPRPARLRTAFKRIVTAARRVLAAIP